MKFCSLFFYNCILFFQNYFSYYSLCVFSYKLYNNLSTVQNIYKIIAEILIELHSFYRYGRELTSFLSWVFQFTNRVCLVMRDFFGFYLHWFFSVVVVLNFIDYWSYFLMILLLLLSFFSPVCFETVLLYFFLNISSGFWNF
jgi:hypothetical protein